MYVDSAVITFPSDAILGSLHLPKNLQLSLQIGKRTLRWSVKLILLKVFSIVNQISNECEKGMTKKVLKTNSSFQIPASTRTTDSTLCFGSVRH